MKNKFTTNLTLSNKGIKEKRASLLGDDAHDAQQDLVRELSSEVRDLERTIMNLEDLSPDSTTSLLPAKGGFDAKKWVVEMQESKVALKMKKVELNVAKATLAEYFTEITEESETQE